MKLPFTKIVISADPVLVKRLQGAEKAADDLTREVQELTFDVVRLEKHRDKLKHQLLRTIDEKARYAAAFEDALLEVSRLKKELAELKEERK